MKKIIKSLVTLFIIIMFIVMLFRVGILNDSLHETVGNITIPIADALGYPTRLVSNMFH